MCIVYFIDMVSAQVNEIFKSNETITIQIEFIKKKIEKSIESRIEQCKEQGIDNQDEIKETLKQMVIDQEMKSFDFLPQSKKLQIISAIQGMFK